MSIPNHGSTWIVPAGPLLAKALGHHGDHMFALLIGIATAQTTFTFTGQPECVQLSYHDGRTSLTNTCKAALLVDASVVTGASILAPGAHAELRDLSAFTLGMDGKLYRVVATIDTPGPTDLASATATPRG